MMNEKCKHKWVDMEDGSYNQKCVYCKIMQMQNVMNPISADLGTSMSMSLGREKIEVPFFNGSEHTRISVYKDDIIKQMNEEIGLTINHFSNMGR